MEARKSTFESQLYLSKQAPIIIRYLEQVSLRYPHIGEIFDTPEKRLFFKSFADENLDDINTVFNTKELLNDFEKRLAYWRPQLNEMSIASVRQLIRDFYFYPIKNHSDWNVFIAKQKKLIEPQFEQKATLDVKIRSLEDELAGAFSFRIISAFLDKNPGKMAEKADLLAKILNVTTSTYALIVQFEDKVKQTAIDQLGFSISTMGHKELLPTLDKLQSTLLFQATERGPIILWDSLEMLLKKYEKPAKEIEKFRKTAATHLFDNILKNNYAASTIEILLDLITSHIEPSIKKKHPEHFIAKAKSVSDSDLLKKRETYKASDPLFHPPARKLSAPPPRQQNPLISPRSESEGSTTPRWNQVGVIRPIRAGQMRRRVSVISLFPSRSSSEEKTPEPVPEEKTPEPSTPRLVINNLL